MRATTESAGPHYAMFVTELRSGHADGVKYCRELSVDRAAFAARIWRWQGAAKCAAENGASREQPFARIQAIKAIH